MSNNRIMYEDIGNLNFENSYFESNINPIVCVEKEMKEKGYKIIAGVDNTGRGAIAGCVVAATVVLSNEIKVPSIKKFNNMSSEKKEEIYNFICNNVKSYSVGIVDNDVIEQMPLIRAVELAMKISIYKMDNIPDVVLSEHIKFSDENINHLSISDGSNRSSTINAASIIARVNRDKLMKKMDNLYPGYGFSENKGYTTKKHIEAIKENGLSPIHRKLMTKKYLEDKKYSQISLFQLLSSKL